MSVGPGPSKMRSPIVKLALANPVASTSAMPLPMHVYGPSERLLNAAATEP